MPHCRKAHVAAQILFIYCTSNIRLAYQAHTDRFHSVCQLHCSTGLALYDIASERSDNMTKPVVKMWGRPFCQYQVQTFDGIQYMRHSRSNSHSYTMEKALQCSLTGVFLNEQQQWKVFYCTVHYWRQSDHFYVFGSMDRPVSYTPSRCSVCNPKQKLIFSEILNRIMYKTMTVCFHNWE